jgi:hypothetical protein
MQASRGKSLILSFLVAAAAVGSASAYADDKLQWRTVIGIVQANNTVGSGAGTVTGAPGPWSTLDGHADVSFETAESISMCADSCSPTATRSVRPGTVAQVKGTLVCDTDGNASGGNSVIVIRRPWSSMTKETPDSTVACHCPLCARASPTWRS